MRLRCDLLSLERRDLVEHRERIADHGLALAADYRRGQSSLR